MDPLKLILARNFSLWNFASAINTEEAPIYAAKKWLLIPEDVPKCPECASRIHSPKSGKIIQCFVTIFTNSSPDEDVVLHSQSTVPEFQSSHQLESQSTIDQAELPTTPAPTPSSSRPTRKRSHPNEDRLEEAYEVLHAAKNRMMSRDEFDVYGQYIGTELRALNDEHSVIMAKYYINNILLDARLGKYRTGYNNQSQPVVQQGYSTASSDISPEPSEEHIIQNIRATMDPRALIALVTLILINLR
ncbi:unnamed protein product [Colias eurytheme]|nr:unnamed protein product [Colias eurytheme]